MYRCDCCMDVTEDRKKQNKVYNYRDKTYTHIKYIYNEKTRKKEKEEFTTQGQEIVGEFNFCAKCFKKEAA
jgi:hypothetical protein